MQPSRSSANRLLLVAVALASVSACSLLGDPVQRQWEDRDPLPSCGVVRWDISERFEDAAVTQVACLETALRSGEGGELVVRHATKEGDPVIEYYRITPAGKAELYTDATKDQFSDGTWLYSSCDHPTSAIDAAC